MRNWRKAQGARHKERRPLFTRTLRTPEKLTEATGTQLKIESVAALPYRTSF
jgi:hypothetical protein